MAKYPTQIQLQGAVVSFDGPVDGTVVILKSISALKTAIIAIYAIGLAMLTYFATELLLTTLADNKISIFDGMDAGTIQTISLVAAAVIGVGTGGLVYAFDALPFDLKFGAYGLA
ncbi:MAG: hypothetical protein HYX48_06330 [Chlamydiales bacterium]|nr:hypothetical protein [Chlamydiales bacterium]